MLRVWSLGLGFGVWVRDWAPFKHFTAYSCANVMYREAGYDSEGTEIDGGGDGNHGVPSHQRRRHTDLDQGGRREG